MGHFELVAKLEASQSGRSFKIYIIKDERWVFFGLITRRTLEMLLDGAISQGDICVYMQDRGPTS